MTRATTSRYNVRPVAPVRQGQILRAKKVNEIIAAIGAQDRHEEPAVPSGSNPQRKVSFGYRLYKAGGSWKVHVYDGYLTIHGNEDLYFAGSDASDVAISGDPVHVFLKVDRAGGDVLELDWANARPTTTPHEYVFVLYEFAYANGRYFLSKVRRGGRDIDLDTPLRQ